ncbi:universal stress protein [Streptomyces sp. MMG1533]|uniref:universal stress protein n=1 Tax=Streptomyces sp. MMG1533 TaxID=1415546 RepID=UPI0006AFE4FC|nr:universal stress protein [Streptomyces sp. MMG1533]KOU57004.1 universal stress protein [Streptomyces sp. MMG1533]
MRERPLVVGVDGSEPSLRAVDWAADEAALRGVPLRVVYASLWERYEGAALSADLDKPSEQVMADDIVAAAARRVRSRYPALMMSVDVAPEEPEYTLPREGRHATAVVVGTRGRSALAEALLGSVSLTVATHAHCPVIVVRGSHDDQNRAPRHGRVLVGVGEDGKESEAVRFAYEEARLRGVPLEAVRAWRCPAPEATDHPLLAGEPGRLHEKRAVEALETALRDAPQDVDVRRRTAEGHPWRVLVEASHHADLLVVGSRGRHGHLGRVAHAVLHHAACPVAVIPASE